MFRKPAVAAGVLLLAVSTRMHALGLGEIDVRSALNEPFDAQVTLTSATNEQLETLRVSIASSEAFARAGIPRTAILREGTRRWRRQKKLILRNATAPCSEGLMARRDQGA